MNKQLKHLIEEIIHIYPAWIRKLVVDRTEYIPKNRYTSKGKLEATYDPETGNVLFWNPVIDSKIDLLTVLSHEIGHKIFQEILTNQERKEWFKNVSHEKIDFSIKDCYPSRKYLEEHFCWLFSVWSLILFLKKINRREKMSEIKNKIEKNYPLGSRTLKKLLRKRSYSRSKTAGQSSPNGIYRSQVIAFKKWVYSVIGSFE